MASPIGAAGSDLGGRGGGVALELDQEGKEGGAHDGDGDGRSEIRTVPSCSTTERATINDSKQPFFITSLCVGKRLHTAIPCGTLCTQTTVLNKEHTVLVLIFAKNRCKKSQITVNMYTA